MKTAWFLQLKKNINTYSIYQTNDIDKANFIYQTNLYQKDALMALQFWLQEVNSATWIQILNEAVYISHTINTFGKGINQTSLHPAMSK